MPDCRLAANDLAGAFLAADGLAHMSQVPSSDEEKKSLKGTVENLESFLQEMFETLERPAFTNFQHDITKLKNEAESMYPSPYFIKRYAEDLQRAILSESLLNIIDCQCKR